MKVCVILLLHLSSADRAARRRQPGARRPAPRPPSRPNASIPAVLAELERAANRTRAASPCFHGCAALGAHRPARLLDTSASFSLVVSWCCESLGWVKAIEWHGLLREVVIVAKCAARDDGAPCDALGAARAVERALARTAPAAAVRAVGMLEPGRRACGASTDECGAFLRFIVERYDELSDGLFFVHGDGGGPHHGGVAPWLLRRAFARGIAPVAYAPLTSNWGPNGDPRPCLAAIDRSAVRLRPAPPPAPFPFPQGFRNGLFYVSRHVVYRRPRAYFERLLEAVDESARCAWTHACALARQRDAGRAASACCDEGWPQAAGWSLPNATCQADVPRSCDHVCSALEHSWHAVFCQPCVYRNSPRREAVF